MILRVWYSGSLGCLCFVSLGFCEFGVLRLCGFVSLDMLDAGVPGLWELLNVCILDLFFFCKVGMVWFCDVRMLCFCFFCVNLVFCDCGILCFCGLMGFWMFGFRGFGFLWFWNFDFWNFGVKGFGT